MFKDELGTCHLHCPVNATRKLIFWLLMAMVVAIPSVAAALSPLLQWRDPIYITAGFAGVVSMILLLLQPLLAGNLLPGIHAFHARRLHRGVGVLLLVLILVHVAGLWLTSPPDVIDALLFRSPTPFSAWGVIAMWALFASAALVALRRHLNWSPPAWRLGHKALALIIVIGSVIHAMLIEGTMELLSKAMLCLLVLAALLAAFIGTAAKRKS